MSRREEQPETTTTAKITMMALRAEPALIGARFIALVIPFNIGLNVLFVHRWRKVKRVTQQSSLTNKFAIN